MALLANVIWMAVSLQVNGGKTGNDLGIFNDDIVTASSKEWKILTQAGNPLLVEMCMFVFFH